MAEILKNIVSKKIEDIKENGYTYDLEIPEKRNVPLVIPDLEELIVICEIKRGSPSEGKMNEIADPVAMAREYIDSKVNVISVITEKNFFYGSLKDLIHIKNNFKHISVLRKDFLIDEEEIVISYKLGADLVLLITSILPFDKLKSMKELAESLGMLPLIEVHNEKELDMVLRLNPKLIGINSRDLKTFKIDRNYPIALKSLIPEDIKVIFESGIRNYTDAFFVGNSGFNGILVGTSIIKSNKIFEKIEELRNGFFSGFKNRNYFYRKIFEKIYFQKKLVVKICGITNIEDALTVREAGADIIGFVFAKSPRQIGLNKAKEICEVLGNTILKVGVVVDTDIENVAQLVKKGYLDAIQFHNDMNNEECISYNVCWYKAVRLKEEKDFLSEFYSPIVLYDAFSPNSYGGTGSLINKELLNFAIQHNIKLYLAGGINIDNVEDILKEFRPLMIDLSSGVEKYPGKKDKEMIYLFFKKIKKIKKFI